MMIEHLGDTADFWKGGMIEDLESSGLLSDLAVDQMIADDAEWQSSTYALYQKLLRIKKSQVIVHKKSFQRNRIDYWKEITHRGDIFFDPNVGIMTSAARPREYYLFPVEIKDAVNFNSDRVVLVYQHACRRLLRQRIADIFHRISGQVPLISCCSYEAGNAAMIYFSRSKLRIKEIYDYHTKSSITSKSQSRSQILLNEIAI